METGAGTRFERILCGVLKLKQEAAGQWSAQAVDEALELGSGEAWFSEWSGCGLSWEGGSPNGLQRNERRGLKLRGHE